MIARPGQIRVGSDVMQGHLLSKVQPVYPDAARSNSTTGTVILSAQIGADGHVHALRPVSAPDPDLVISAIAAVRQWTYTPYLLNGIPTPVSTTITVNYSMR